MKLKTLLSAVLPLAVFLVVVLLPNQPGRAQMMQAIVGGNPPSSPVYTDNFTRANETPLAGNWTVVFNTVNLTSNAAVPNAGVAWNAAYWSANTFGANQFSQVTVGPGLGNDGAGAMVRSTTSASTYTNYACFEFGADSTLYLVKNIAGSQHVLNSTSITLAPGDVIRLQVSGSALSCTLNGGTPALTATDPTLSSGCAGIALYRDSGFPQIHAWSGGDL